MGEESREGGRRKGGTHTSRAGVRVPSTSNRQMMFLISRSARGGYEAMAAVGGERNLRCCFCWRSGRRREERKWSKKEHSKVIVDVRRSTKVKVSVSNDNLLLFGRQTPGCPTLSSGDAERAVGLPLLTPPPSDQPHMRRSSGQVGNFPGAPSGVRGQYESVGLDRLCSLEPHCMLPHELK